ncbi:MAG: methyltransferase domain-containing protein [Verrucomicrobiota bacterium]
MRKEVKKRWELFRSGTSVLRFLEYRAIRGVALKGAILDLGGGKRMDYHSIFDVDGDIDSVNFSEAVEPTYLADLNEPLPIENDRYDTCISLNCFEHIYRDELACSEMMRVLRAGGEFHVLVPFLYRVHGSPEDYHRLTESCWQKRFLELGAESETLEIEALGMDPVVGGWSLIEAATPGVRVFRCLALLMGFVFFLKRNEWRDFALGYYIRGKKSER